MHCKAQSPTVSEEEGSSLAVAREQIKMARSQGVAPMLAVALVLLAATPTGVQSIGVCYGVHGDRMPSAAEVVQLYQSKGIRSMRIYFADRKALQALSGSNIGLIMDIDNGNLAKFARDPSAAKTWVQNNVKAFPDVNFRYITVGNEISGSDTKFILPAMKNVNSALAAAGLGKIKVSTALRMDALDKSSPPSAGVFKDPGVMSPIVRFLASNGAPLLANVYPYFAYRDNDGIELNYALFQPSSTTVTDNGRTYKNLFDAMVDAVRAAVDKAGGGVDVVVSESGWPSAGGRGASVDNARKYNQNLINHARKGTPKKPGAMEVYIFAMFNENQKPGAETEKHFGLFNPTNKSPVYQIDF